MRLQVNARKMLVPGRLHDLVRATAQSLPPGEILEAPRLLLRLSGILQDGHFILLPETSMASKHTTAVARTAPSRWNTAPAILLSFSAL